MGGESLTVHRSPLTERRIWDGARCDGMHEVVSLRTTLRRVQDSTPDIETHAALGVKSAITLARSSGYCHSAPKVRNF